ncbi:CYFA0S26e00496g1_1 [Cyberlindnera fabianii]|uniref:Biogenesis of lysosome-related organelles complex 1 subunit KXD1 n=1 Tax=Cyberlindnera fabianii TaxID=36022 RepID=A0A061BG07_CYBFA|nr:Biogenesis of lysosome-related organelles complex 1 subunit KXD1 [Cyberlindnera fabianii]CDR46825.1 CYFA0S26e00496g1_1 [Cyberlindnera fabianii]
MTDSIGTDGPTETPDDLLEPRRHSRQPSISSQTFAVTGVVVDPVNDGDDDDDNSTDSYESAEEPPQFDPVAFLKGSLDTALTRMEFSRSVAVQAQMSGRIKSKEMELLALQDEATRRLVELQQTFKKGIRNLQTVARDLKQNQLRAQHLTKAVQAKHPIEFSQARDKVVSRNISPAEFGDGGNDDEIYI